MAGDEDLRDEEKGDQGGGRMRCLYYTNYPKYLVRRANMYTKNGGNLCHCNNWFSDNFYE